MGEPNFYEAYWEKIRIPTPCHCGKEKHTELRRRISGLPARLRLRSGERQEEVDELDAVLDAELQVNVVEMVFDRFQRDE